MTTTTTLLSGLGLALAFAAPALAQDLQFELINASDSAVVQFFTSPSTMNEWREDILGTDVLGAGESGTVTITDGSDQCVYDIRVVLEDSSEMTDTVDICEMSSYTLTSN